MNVSDQVIKIINEIASKLGVAAEKVYPVMVKQAQIEGIKAGILILLGIVGLVITFRLIKRGMDVINGRRDSNEEDLESFICILGGIIIGVISLFFVGLNMNTCLTGLLNPEYYVFNKIFEMIRQ